MSPPRKLPASAAIEYVLPSPELTRAVTCALSAIDLVHDDGHLPRIPLKINPRLRRTEGQYLHRGSVAHGIQLRPAGDTVSWALLEEMGHFLDHQALGTGGFGFASEDAQTLAGFRHAAEKTEAVQTLRRLISNGRAADDYGSGREIFGRAYAQFIAIKSGDPVLLAGLRADISTIFGPALYWSKADFRPIMQELENLFKSKGWL